MKTFVSLSLALLIFLAPLSKMWILVSFEINRASIAQTYCEQKAVEDNVCQGACHLKKQLEDAEQESDKLPQSVKEKAEVLYCHVIPSWNITNKITPLPTTTPEAFYLASTSLAFAGDILHPPIS